MPKGINPVYFVLADVNVYACLLLIIAEHTFFDDRFIRIMNRNIFLIVIISVVVSLIQIKDPTFFYNTSIDKDLMFVEEGESRNTSIYTWAGQNSGGITFPILIAIMLNYHPVNSFSFLFIVLSGIVVSFLSKARYAMISMLVVFSQLFFSGKKSVSYLISMATVFIISLGLIIFIAGEVGFNIDEVISQRILEKDSDMASARARITSYKVFMIKFPEHPWLGVGPETREDVLRLLGGEAPMIHVGYLSYLYYYGVIGCFFFFLAVFFLLKQAWQVGRRFEFWAAFYGLISFLLANVTLVNFHLGEMGIVLLVIYMRYYLTTDTENEFATEQISYSN